MYLSKVKVKEAMEVQGIRTFTELADCIGITKNQLSVMMSDSYNPIKSRVEELCRQLNVRPDEIMDFDTPISVSDSIDFNSDDVTAIELFAGAGGLALGLEQAGIKTLQYVEFDKACCETLRLNRPEWNVVCDDIHNVDFTEFRGKVDIVSGTDFPEDLSVYDLIIQCGGCMFNRKYIMSRIDKAKNKNIPMTNYGVAIAHITGILDNIVTP